MSELKVNCIDESEDFLFMGQVYDNTDQMYVYIEMPGEERSEDLMCNVFIGKAEAIQIINHLKEQYNL